MQTENWETGLPRTGAQIRVRTDNYFHHGIYVGEERVAEFGSGTAADRISPEEVKIRLTDFQSFSDGKTVEVRTYSPDELLSLLPGHEIVKRALSKLGEGGYDFLYNNCEHFSNYCAFGRPYSLQSEDFKLSVLEKFKNHTVHSK